MAQTAAEAGARFNAEHDGAESGAEVIERTAGAGAKRRTPSAGRGERGCVDLSVRRQGMFERPRSETRLCSTNFFGSQLEKPC